MNIGIYLYDNAEVLDFAGPFEVFSTAKRLGAEWDICLIAEQANPVQARGGFSVLPHYSIGNHPALDVLIVVGGVHTGELAKQEVLNWIDTTSRTSGIVASVCTGAFLLAEAGVLKHGDVTTHWEDIPALERNYPSLNVIRDRRWVESGKFITSGGISAGIDMSLHLVRRLASSELAVRTARQMEYDWKPDASA